jgi:hypothetical protein
MEKERVTRTKQVFLQAVTATAAIITTTILVIEQLK